MIRRHVQSHVGGALGIAGHPVAGGIWEGFVIESLLAAAPEPTQASFS